jgi:hypothetical protein
VLADHGAGQTERVGGCRERAEIDRPDEDLHAGQPIHIRNSWLLLLCLMRGLSLPAAKA